MLKGISIAAVLAGSLALSAVAQPPAKPAEPPKPAPSKPAEQPKKPEAPKAPDAAKAMDKDILATAATTGNHMTFISLVKAAGLENDLKGAGPFTVFAPTDEAFKKLPAATLADLQKPENKSKLANILKFHVIKGKMMAADITKLNGKESEKTLEGHSFKIESKDGKVMVGTDAKSMAQVTKADVSASNGVIHAIDTVMMPPSGDAKKDEHKKDEPKKEEPKKDTAPPTKK